MKQHDWAARMFEQIEAAKTMPFEWGVNDCCLFVARCVDAMTGSTFESQLHGRYSDKASALEMIGSSLAVAVSEFLGLPSEGSPVRGDVVLFAGGEGEALGICTGRIIVGVGPEGLHSVPVSETLAFWRT